MEFPPHPPFNFLLFPLPLPILLLLLLLLLSVLFVLYGIRANLTRFLVFIPIYLMQIKTYYLSTLEFVS